MLIRRVNLLNIALIAICLFFAARIYRVWSEENEIRSEPHERAERAREPSLMVMDSNPPVEPQVVDFILEHDLFQESRTRPLSSESSNLPPPPVLNAALHGIFVDEKGNRVLIQDLSAPNAKPRWMRVGESVGEFRVTRIREGEVELEARGTNKVLVMFNNARPKVQQAQQTPLQPGAPQPVRPGPQPPAQAPIAAERAASQREALLNRLREARRQLPGALQQAEPRQSPQPQGNPPLNTPESPRPRQEGD